MFKFKEDENFNHPDEIGTGIHTLSILRIALKLHFVQNVESDPREIGSAFHGAGSNTFSFLRIKLKLLCEQNVESDTEIGQKGAFCKGLVLIFIKPLKGPQAQKLEKRRRFSKVS